MSSLSEFMPYHRASVAVERSMKPASKIASPRLPGGHEDIVIVGMPGRESLTVAPVEFSATLFPGLRALVWYKTVHYIVLRSILRLVCSGRRGYHHYHRIGSLKTKGPSKRKFTEPLRHGLASPTWRRQNEREKAETTSHLVSAVVYKATVFCSRRRIVQWCNAPCIRFHHQVWLSFDQSIAR